jgi:hypothetical protein
MASIESEYCIECRVSPKDRNGYFCSKCGEDIRRKADHIRCEVCGDLLMNNGKFNKSASSLKCRFSDHSERTIIIVHDECAERYNLGDHKCYVCGIRVPDPKFNLTIEFAMNAPKSITLLCSQECKRKHYDIGVKPFRKMLDLKKICDNCGKIDTKLMKCSRCKSAYYCSAECQKCSWKKHKLDCKQLTV